MNRISYILLLIICIFVLISVPISAQYQKNITPSKDATVNNATPDHNDGTSSLIGIWNEANNGIAVSLLYFSLSTIPNNAKITSAALGLYCFSKSSNSQRLGIGELDLPFWSETSVTWNNKPTFHMISDYNIGQTNQYTLYDVTSIVKGWFIGTPIINNGFILTSTTVGSATFYSREQGNGYLPVLYVKYDVLPPAPNNPNPSDGATNKSITTVISWTGGGSAVAYYKVYFGTDASLNNSSDYKGDFTNTSFNPGTLNYNTTYYWGIGAVNAAGTTWNNNGTPWHFTTESGTSLPSKPINPSPSDGATNQSTLITLSWINGGGASSYDVYFGTVQNNLTYKGTVSSPSISYSQLYGALNNNTNYYWRIDAKNSAGTTTGDVWHFATINVQQIYRTLTVSSLNPNSGVNITVSPNDNNNMGNGLTEFHRIYNDGTMVTLSAPSSLTLVFQKWQRDGSDYSTNQNISLAIYADYTFTAVYQNKTSVEDKLNVIPLRFKLYQNYPNPFNPTTTIKFSIPIETRHVLSLHVLLKVFDLLGREVVTLVNEEKPPGNYEVIFDGTSAKGGLPSGVYFYTLHAGNYTETKKMLLMK